MSDQVIAVIHLTSYGFLHPGRERFKRVTKEAWRLIPGSTFYGAVAATLIRLDCHKEKAKEENCQACFKQDDNTCGYVALLKEVQENRLRFSPLVVTEFTQEQYRYTAADYSREAALAMARLGICPRAPLGRETFSIYKERLHGLAAHQPFQSYRGFLLADPEFLNKHIRRALLALPFFPFGGGRGKFTQVQAEIIRKYHDFSDFCPPQPVKYLGLLTPAILPIGARAIDPIGGAATYKVANFRLRRYTCWRTGLYWEATELKSYGGPAVKDHLTQARLGLAENAILHLQGPNPHAVQELFLHGLGAEDFRYLGWGQVYFKE